MPSPPHPDDLRDPETFAEWYARLAPAARATALSILRDQTLAEDVVQDVFVTLWARPEVFEPARGSIGSLVRVMARSRSLDRLRARAARESAAAGLAAEARLREPAASPEEVVVRRDEGREVLRQLDRQGPGQRAAVLLHHVAGLSDREVAAATRVPLGTAKSRIRLGVRRAAEALAA
jgi:RNA polymerase sigma-70 factor (ECF subfamily)